MYKNKLNYKLINISLLLLVLFLLYKTSSFWFYILGKAWQILFPFLIAFIIAYALYPIKKYLIRKKIPKNLATMLIILLILGIFVGVSIIVFPLLANQIVNLFNGIISFLKELSLKYDFNFMNLQQTLYKSFNTTIDKMGTYISDGALNVIGLSINYISKIFIIFAATVYFLIDMERIRKYTRKFLLARSKRAYEYIELLDHEMHNYLSGFIKIVFISLIEYSLIYTIIGHPDAMLLGVLAALGNLIPYFGGIITNIVAAITAFVISPVLFIKTLIVLVVFSAIDGYIINPFVYGKSNSIHPLAVIIAVFAGGILFGLIGVVISLPMAIIAISTYKYFKEDIYRIKEKIEK